MVSNATIFAMLISILVCFVFPIGLAVSFKNKQRGIIGPLMVGFLSFVIFQMYIRIPILQYVLPGFEWYINMSVAGKILFLGITAGLFETFGRWASIKLLLSKRLSYNTGILHGIGHGGIEAIIFVGINFIAYLTFASKINQMGLDAFILTFIDSGELAVTQITTIGNSLINEPSWTFLIVGYQRVLTMIIHIGFSLLVMQGFVNNKVLRYSIIAFLLHATLDCGAVALKEVGVGVLWIEGYVTLFALAMAVYVFKSKPMFGSKIAAKIENQKYIDSNY